MTVHGVAKSQTQLSDFTIICQITVLPTHPAPQISGIELTYPYALVEHSVWILFFFYLVSCIVGICFTGWHLILKSESRSAMSDSSPPHGLHSPWNSLGQNPGVGNHTLLQEICPAQGSNPGVLHCRQILYQLNHKGSPSYSSWYIISGKELSYVIQRY